MRVKNIIDFPGYEITDRGEIYSYKTNTKTLLKENRVTGYSRVKLSKNNKTKDFLIHRLVAIHFLENPNNFEVVNHIDGNKFNNCVENLEWISQKGNMQHYVDVILKRKKMNEKQEEALQKITDYDEVFEEMIKRMEAEQEEFWNSLTKDQQLMAFCAICRRIVRGEIKDKGSYRYILYDVFGFGQDSYMPAQLAGFMAIHNAIDTEFVK